MKARSWFWMAVAVCMMASPATSQEAPSQETPPQETTERTGDDTKDGAEKQEVLAGHSYHGDAFNEGPRQQAYLMEGLGRVHFPVTTSDAEAQKFVTQGVAQLHGFWYFEAERSFRQAAAIDPDCAMAYWGMALANRNNSKRATAFIAEALERKDKVERREQLYIDALDAYLKADRKKRKERAEKYTKALERLIYEFPDDVEARAFLALQLWNNRSSGVPITSYLAIDALIDQVFAAEPMHPAHHYRIHLWDYEKPERALGSAAKCGQSLPAIAHMWHMPGHTYSRVKRYDDAAWQQEASARVDHAHMMRDRVMPDQIHNFAHNNEWLIRNLNHVGRVRDAVDLAKNMTELPRHPKNNTVEKRGSTYYGRLRLFETLSRYELWEEMIALCDSPYLEPTDNVREQIKRLRHLGRAYFRSGNLEQGVVRLEQLAKRLEDEQSAKEKAGREAANKIREEAVNQDKLDKIATEAGDKALKEGLDQEGVAKAKREAEEAAKEQQIATKKKEIEKAKEEAEKPFRSKIGDLEKAVAELEGLKAIAEGDNKTALERLKKAGIVEPMFLASVRSAAGEPVKAIEDGRKYIARHPKEVHPLAMLVDLLWQAGKKEEARIEFEKLREISSLVDLDSPVFTRLAEPARELGFPDDWRVAVKTKDDVGERPDLDALGPFRWSPSPAPTWTLQGPDGTLLGMKQFQGQPVVVIFYLGYGCLHCAEQLHAFAPKVEEFREAGLEIVAISTDDMEGLRISIDNYDKGDLPIPLLANAELDIFKAYRCFDDFEDQPLHGTFIIDGNGLVRWQETSYEPFMDPDFVLKEARRLLSQDEPTRVEVTTAADEDGTKAAGAEDVRAATQ